MTAHSKLSGGAGIVSLEQQFIDALAGWLLPV
jgi:hypothetical protein